MPYLTPNYLTPNEWLKINTSPPSYLTHANSDGLLQISIPPISNKGGKCFPLDGKNLFSTLFLYRIALITCIKGSPLTVYIKSWTAAIKILNIVEFLEKPTLIFVLTFLCWSYRATLICHADLQGTRRDSTWIIVPYLHGLEIAAHKLHTMNWGKLRAGKS